MRPGRDLQRMRPEKFKFYFKVQSDNVRRSDERFARVTFCRAPRSQQQLTWGRSLQCYEWLNGRMDDR